MKTRKTDVIKPCDLCGAVGNHYYDAPTVSGQWANMCPKCMKTKACPHTGHLGTKFVLRTKVAGVAGILYGIGVNSMEAVFMDDDREIECPNCHELKFVEPDADYVYECEGCGSKVRVPCLM